MVSAFQMILFVVVGCTHVLTFVFSVALFLGRKFQPPKQLVFNSGGAGYLLNTAALEILGSHLDAPACYPKQRGFWEDVNVANCLLKGGNVVPYDTRDPLLRERFHPFNPGTCGIQMHTLGRCCC